MTLLSDSDIPLSDMFDLADDSKLRCLCGFDYVHLGEPQLYKGNDNYEAPWNGRGDLLVIPAHCENDCRFEICYGFHKGQTFSFARLQKRGKHRGDGNRPRAVDAELKKVRRRRFRVIG